MAHAQDTRALCVLLVLQAVVSFRSVPRILNLFNLTGHGQLSWVPHFTSVINWTLRLGLGLLNQVKPIAEPWVAILDHSIDIGTKKALAVLRVTMDALSNRKQAIRLEDCECVGLSIAEKVDGESISKDLEPIFKAAGTPVAVLKDCDRTLNKGVELWADSCGDVISIIDDLGHVMANALKAQFEKSESYIFFTSLISSGAKKLRQTDLAFITPPKLRTKGRFQSIGRVAKWAAKMLVMLQDKNSGIEDGTLSRIQAAFPDFTECSEFIENFAHVTGVLSQVMKVLKNKGIDLSTHDQCLELSAQLPQDSKVRQSLASWLQQHLIIQENLHQENLLQENIIIQEKTTSLPLLISSDIIESLFGSYKHVLHRSPQADMNRTALLLPALCGKQNGETITQALHQANHAELKSWENDNIPYTVRKKRQEFFLPLKPNTGELIMAI